MGFRSSRIRGRLVKKSFAERGDSRIVARMNHVEQIEALEAARRAGIDLDLLDTNLELSVKERWQQHDAAMELALKLEAAGKARDAKLQSTTPAAV